MMTKKEYLLKKARFFGTTADADLPKSDALEKDINPKNPVTMSTKKEIWTKVLKFLVELLKLILAAFLGITGSNVLG